MARKRDLLDRMETDIAATRAQLHNVVTDLRALLQSLRDGNVPKATIVGKLEDLEQSLALVHKPMLNW